MRKLPVDISTFSELRTSNYVYVDKTEYAYRLITGGRRFFLSRPRRFGKSLFISTLKEILTVNKMLFDDLWIGKSDYHWQEYGVINLDFSIFAVDNIVALEENLQNALLYIAETYQIVLDNTLTQSNLILKNLVTELYKKFGRVAVLVDEYDSPILKALKNEALAIVVRDKIQQFFTTIKGLDAHIQFVFITGVTSFAKAGLFSGINNLQIITLQDPYAAICGYSDQEIDNYFKDYIAAWAEKEHQAYDDLRQQIKLWYDGYHFGENVVAVYNPFSFMNALHIQKFKNFWFQSGTPTFLVEILKKESSTFDSQAPFRMSEDALAIFDVGVTPLVTLMFQAGYLSISSYDRYSELYTLDYPNVEVRRSFQKYLLEVFAHINSIQAERLSSELKIAFMKEHIDDVITLIKRLFAHVPYQLHIKEEKFYHALLMMVCVGAGIKAQSEYSISHGRIDLVLDFPEIIYVIEIKFNQSAEIALAQIEERRYYERFMINNNKHIMLLGLAFKREPHNFDVTYALKKIL
ncbi:MAG TPA: AAA family ATPase [Candidatus Babeliales bacterium]|nr:AAA family ATPase [Candidatus Babeliales bacterium]